MISTFIKRDTYLNAGILFVLSILSGIILWTFPRYFIFIFPGLALISLSIAILLRNPVYFLYVYFLSFTLHLDNEPGIQVTDLIFFILSLIFLLLFFFPYLITGRAEIDNSIDKWYLLLFISIVYGFIIGLLDAKSKSFAVSDMTYFLGLWLYFPFKYHFKSEQFQKAILAIFILICFFVLIRNFINYREIVIQANVEWEIQKARVAMNEIIILSGAILSVLSFSHFKQKLIKVGSYILYALFLAGLVLTQSRGYWIGFVVALMAIYIVSDKHVRRHLLFGTLALIVFVTLTTFFFFNDIFSIIIKALEARWDSISTIGSASRMGPSLLERVYETQTIVHKLLHNPIAGYGMGVMYHRYYILFGTYRTMTFIHNGYLAIWFKTGIVGLIAATMFCLSTLKYLRKIVIYSDTKLLKIVSQSAFGLVVAILIVNITSAQFIGFENMMILALIAAFTSYYATHWLPSRLQGKQSLSKS